MSDNDIRQERDELHQALIEIAAAQHATGDTQ